MRDLQIEVIPRELYYHEVAYVRGLEAALRPFAKNADAESLIDALGHITREDMLRARAALNVPDRESSTQKPD